MSSAIVIGGGMYGAALAWRLAERGVDVTLLESGRLGGGASRVSFAWLNASNKQPRAYYQLNVDGMNEYWRVQRELGGARWLHRTGNTEWAASSEAAETLREKVERLRGWGYTAEVLPVAELGAIEPDLHAPSEVEWFAWYPHEGYIDPLDAIADMAGRARALGASLREETRVVDLLRDGERVSGVVIDGGENIHADRVIVAAGNWSRDVMAMAGIELPMASTVGMVAVSGPTTARLRSVHHDDGMNIRPDGAGRLMMRHGDFDSLTDPSAPEAPPPAWLDDLVSRVALVLPGVENAGVEAMRVTMRPIPGDGHPMVGPVPGVDGLYLLTSHSGVTLAPLLARLAADEIAGGRADARLSPFRPDRLVTAMAAR